MYDAVRSKHIYAYDRPYVRATCVECNGCRDSMEDRHAACVSSPKLMKFGVFDGHEGSGVAEACRTRLLPRLKRMDHDHIVRVFCEFDRELRERKETSGAVAAVVLLDSSGNGVVAHVGDCRVLVIRNVPLTHSKSTSKNKHRTEALTTDHRPRTEGEMDRIVKAGYRVSMGRVNGMLAPSRAFGDFPYKPDDLKPAEQAVTPVPECVGFRLTPKDVLLLLCDGFAERRQNEETADTFVRLMNTHKGDLDASLCGLIDSSIDAGSMDNHCGLAVRLHTKKDRSRNEIRFVAGELPPMDFVGTNFRRAYRADALRARPSDGISGTNAVKAFDKVLREHEGMVRQHETKVCGVCKAERVPGGSLLDGFEAGEGARYTSLDLLICVTCGTTRVCKGCCRKESVHREPAEERKEEEEGPALPPKPVTLCFNGDKLLACRSCFSPESHCVTRPDCPSCGMADIECRDCSGHDAFVRCVSPCCSPLGNKPNGPNQPFSVCANCSDEQMLVCDESLCLLSPCCLKCSSDTDGLLACTACGGTRCSDHGCGGCGERGGKRKKALDKRKRRCLGSRETKTKVTPGAQGRKRKRDSPPPISD